MAEMTLVNPHLFPYDFRGEGEWNSSRALNYGLLSIASYLRKKEMEAVVLDLQGLRSPLAKLDRHISSEEPKFVGVGCVSALSYLPTLEIAKLVKEIDKGIFVGIGGQHTRFLVREVLSISPDVDFVFTGEGEETTEQLHSWLKGQIALADVGGIAFRKNGNIITTPPNPPIDLNIAAPVDYSLYPGYKELFPLVEDSRGCPWACCFCSNKNVYGSKIRFKDPHLLLEEIQHLFSLYGRGPLPLIFYNSIFGVNPDSAKEIITGIRRLHLDVRFLTSTRVDSRWERYVEDAEGLCDQMHFGLESASPEILLRMGKTQNPRTYVERARKAVREFHRRGVHVALNILTGFCGENNKTLRDTENFLEANKEHIDSIRSHPLMLFPGSPLRSKIKKFEEVFGSRIRSNAYSDKIHAYPVDATPEFTFDDATEYGKQLMRKYNSFASFYDYYKWLVGPVQQGEGISFLEKSRFLELLSDVDPSRFDFSNAKQRGINGS